MRTTLILVAALLGGCSSVEEIKQDMVDNLVTTYGIDPADAAAAFDESYAKLQGRRSKSSECRGTIRKFSPGLKRTEWTCRSH